VYLLLASLSTKNLLQFGEVYCHLRPAEMTIGLLVSYQITINYLGGTFLYWHSAPSWRTELKAG
jgi:hypothetical protein